MEQKYLLKNICSANCLVTVYMSLKSSKTSYKTKFIKTKVYFKFIMLREAIQRKNRHRFGFFLKGWWGSCLNSNVSRNFFVLFRFGQFSERGGCFNPNLLRNFSAWVWTFLRKRGEGAVPHFINFEELFCLSLEIFEEGGGGYLIPKMMRNFLLPWLGRF